MHHRTASPMRTSGALRRRRHRTALCTAHTTTGGRRGRLPPSEEATGSIPLRRQPCRQIWASPKSMLTWARSDWLATTGSVRRHRERRWSYNWPGEPPNPPVNRRRLRLASGAQTAPCCPHQTGRGDQTSVTELHFTQLTHQIPVDRCTSTIVATVGVYEVTDEGFLDRVETSLPALTATCTYPKLPTARPWPGVVLASGPFLRGIDYDTPPEGTTTAYLHWCGPGQALVVRQDDAQAIVQQLASGACQTVSLSLGASTTLAPDLAGTTARRSGLFGLPWPRAPRQRALRTFRRGNGGSSAMAG